MINWKIPTPEQIKSSRLRAGYDRKEDAAAALGVKLRTWNAWEEPPGTTRGAKMSPQNWLLWQILTRQVELPEKLTGSDLINTREPKKRQKNDTQNKRS